MLSDERGETLIGLLVGMVLGLLALATASQAFIGGNRVAAHATDRVEAVQRARRAVDRFTAVLSSQVCLGPGAPPVVSGTASELVLHADVGDEAFTPERHRFRLQGSSFVEQVTDGVGTPPATTFPGAPRSVVLATNVAAPVGEPLLRYFAFHPTLGAQQLVELPVPLSAVDTARVVRIEIALAVWPARTRTDDPRATTLQAGVGPASIEPSLEWQAGPRCG